MTSSRPDCSTPLDAATLVDYWIGQLSPPEEQAVEEHLMECDACGDRLRDTIALSEALQALARSGSLQVVVSNQFVEHAADTGKQVRQYAASPGEHVQCTVSADDDLLVSRFAVDLTKAPRVDLAWYDTAGREHQRLTDIPVRADAGRVIVQQSMTWAKASPSATMIVRLLSVDEGEGREQLLGEYTFHHTRTISGPPGFEIR